MLSLKDVTASGKYKVSTVKLWDRGWETMVFGKDPSTGNFTSAELDSDWYNDADEAVAGHDLMLQKWEKM